MSMMLRSPTASESALGLSSALSSLVNKFDLTPDRDKVVYCFDANEPEWRSLPAAWYHTLTGDIVINLGKVYSSLNERHPDVFRGLILVDSKGNPTAAWSLVSNTEAMLRKSTTYEHRAAGRYYTFQKDGLTYNDRPVLNTHPDLRNSLRVEMFSSANAAHLLRGTLIAILLHETGHATFSSYILEDWYQNLSGYQRKVMTMFEELRCERQQLKRIGVGADLIRGAADVVVDPKQIFADLSRAREKKSGKINVANVALNSTLCLGRVGYGAFLRYEVVGLQNLVTDVVGEDRYEQAEQIWDEFSDIRELESGAMLKCVDRWIELFPSAKNGSNVSSNISIVVKLPRPEGSKGAVDEPTPDEDVEDGPPPPISFTYDDPEWADEDDEDAPEVHFIDLSDEDPKPKDPSKKGSGSASGDAEDSAPGEGEDSASGEGAEDETAAGEGGGSEESDVADGDDGEGSGAGGDSEDVSVENGEGDGVAGDDVEEEELDLPGIVDEYGEEITKSTRSAESAPDHRNHEGPPGARQSSEASFEQASRTSPISKVYQGMYFPGREAPVIMDEVMPDAADVASAAQLSKEFRNLNVAERTKKVINTAVPPGKLRSRAAVLGAAQEASGYESTAQPWRTAKYKVDHNPPLRVGIITDTSGSMAWSTEFSSRAAWILSRAVTDIQGKVAAASFGNEVTITLKPGEYPRKRVEILANGGYEEFDIAVGAVDSMLKMVSGIGIRILFVISDGCFGKGEGTEMRKAAEWVQDLERSGCLVVWITPDVRSYIYGLPTVPAGAVQLKVDKKGVQMSPDIAIRQVADVVKRELGRRHGRS